MHTDYEQEFWERCYVAALSSGKSSRHAVGAANQAVEDLRERMEVIAVNRQAAA